jgi:hypothetical protein
MKSQRNNHTLLQAATNQPTNQSLQERVIVPPHKKLFSKNFPPFKKIKNTQRTVLPLTDTASKVNRFGQSVCKLDTTALRTDRRASANSIQAIAAGSVLIWKFTFLL